MLDCRRRSACTRMLMSMADGVAGLQEAQRLYENACEKAKALLEDEPENVGAWRACSQALLQLSLLLQPSQPSPAQDCLQVRHLLTLLLPFKMSKYYQTTSKAHAEG